MRAAEVTGVGLAIFNAGEPVYVKEEDCMVFFEIFVIFEP